ncbi:LexA family transcriptional regulator [Salmonella enterica subsp. enterica serovar Tennessee]|nr:LexA family transcriptional regulator [Salmonella enterica subsp. enterica serovar Tennessee]EBY5906507.1 LexA family transcriptional regulator [Salmonella enterica subsp. enterica serovar Tennessee]ECF4905818.1 LexA family transcriptional regulator [Salmonella enterica subsp. enterica serovar Tennessee]ECG2147591.1 LexA family transcriptional regulator [Salmonella enterica subsp. enterica serovar Tennessee]ECR5983132.1 LexA family transcriptional regulator [Salmonella enterica subsp. enteri
MTTQRRLTTEQLRDAERLKALYESKKKELGITQQHIAEEMSITQSAVGHYLNGRNALNVSSAMMFAKILNVQIRDFSPSLAKEVGLMHSYAENVNFIGGNENNTSYPVISWVSAGCWTEALEPYAMKDIDEWISSDAHIEGTGFWLRVRGDSMTSPVGISIPEGMAILVDTGKSPINGSLVVAKLEDTNEATFKKYIEDGGQKFLKPLNPMYPLTPINGNCKIIGVVVEAKYRFM